MDFMWVKAYKANLTSSDLKKKIKKSIINGVHNKNKIKKKQKKTNV